MGVLGLILVLAIPLEFACSVKNVRSGWRLAPFDDDSGERKGSRHIAGGEIASEKVSKPPPCPQLSNGIQPWSHCMAA